MTSLQDLLLAAHASADKQALVGLYTQAADDTADIDAACFFLTHAYIYALEIGDPAAQALYLRLKAHNRV
jgi:hypothetical protein